MYSMSPRAAWRQNLKRKRFFFCIIPRVCVSSWKVKIKEGLRTPYHITESPRPTKGPTATQRNHLIFWCLLHLYYLSITIRTALWSHTHPYIQYRFAAGRASSTALWSNIEVFVFGMSGCCSGGLCVGWVFERFVFYFEFRPIWRLHPHNWLPNYKFQIEWGLGLYRTACFCNIMGDLGRQGKARLSF